MTAYRALFVSGLIALSLMLLGASPMRVLPGSVRPYACDASYETPSITARQDRLAVLAAQIRVRNSSWPEVANRLAAVAERELGPLSPMDRYWLGSAWWAVHQPERHLNRPAWALDAHLRPELALEHSEGGNCESSSNAHAALLTALGVPSLPVYGYHHGAREGHVWTMSDVGGHPMLADVHLARNPWGVWRPRPEDVMSAPTREAARTFLRYRSPDNPAQSGLAPSH